MTEENQPTWNAAKLINIGILVACLREQVMADKPFLAVVEFEQLFTSHEKHAPAHPPATGIGLPILAVEDVFAPNGIEFDFDIDPFLKECLLDGLDDIGLTMQKDGEIDSFEKEQSGQQPWLYRDAS